MAKSELYVYHGDVTIISKNHGVVTEVKKYHNQGEDYLFEFLCQCLCGTIGVLENRPCVIRVSGMKNSQKADAAGSAFGKYVKDGDTSYAEISATFTQSSFGAGGFATDDGDNVTLTMLDVTQNRPFATTSVTNFTNLAKGESVTIVWRMSFQNPTLATTPSTQSVAKVARSRKTTTTKTKEVEVVVNG